MGESLSMYWMMEVGSPDGASIATIGKQPSLSGILEFFTWYGGVKIEVELPSDMKFYLSESSGDFIPDFFCPSIPLMTNKILNILDEAGVDNIDRYKVELYDQGGKLISRNYCAINILDRVSCADLEQSDCEFDNPGDLVGIDFESLVIDEERAKGYNLFRLHEAVNGIVVHDSVKVRLEKEMLAGVYFVRPEDWSG